MQKKQKPRSMNKKQQKFKQIINGKKLKEKFAEKINGKNWQKKHASNDQGSCVDFGKKWKRTLACWLLVNSSKIKHQNTLHEVQVLFERVWQDQQRNQDKKENTKHSCCVSFRNQILKSNSIKNQMRKKWGLFSQGQVTKEQNKQDSFLQEIFQGKQWQFVYW